MSMSMTVAVVLTVVSFGFMVLTLVAPAVTAMIAFNRKVRQEHDKKAREQMLRILPQLSREEFKRIIEQLGWVKERPLGGFVIIRPDREFATIAMIGQTYGSIVSNWNQIWGTPLGEEFANLATNLVVEYSTEEIKDFLVGMRRTAPDQFRKLEDLINQARSEHEGHRNAEGRAMAIAAGLKAAGIKIK